MTAATRRQEGKWRNARMPIGESIRTPARHAPPCGSASSIALPRRIELQKKGPKQRQARSGQVTRPTGVSRASGRGSNCCGNVSSGGGDWTPPQQPCNRPHHKTGRVRLPGQHGLDGAWHPGRRRADARLVKKRGSFGSLRNWLRNSARDAVSPVKLVRAATGQRDHYEPVPIRDPSLLPLVDSVACERAANSVEFSLYRGGATCSFDQI